MKKKVLALLTALLCFTCLMMVGPQAFAADTAEDAAKEAADAAVLLEQAKTLLDDQDYDAAFLLIEKAAETGDAKAQRWLGDCYSQGFGVEQDYKEAAKYYQLSADQGDAEAVKSLAFCYF